MSENKTRLKVTFIFIPGHVGIKGNERTDKLTNIVAVIGGRAMECVDILNAIWDTSQTKDSEGGLDSIFLVQQLELWCCGVLQQDVKRNERCTGK